MNLDFSQISKNSLMSSLYSDRSHHQYLHSSEIKKQQTPTLQHFDHHANPAKAKVNIFRPSLTKNQNYNTTINDIRNSCMIGNYEATSSKIENISTSSPINKYQNNQIKGRVDKSNHQSNPKFNTSTTPISNSNNLHFSHLHGYLYPSSSANKQNQSRFSQAISSGNLKKNNTSNVSLHINQPFLEDYRRKSQSVHSYKHQKQQPKPLFQKCQETSKDKSEKDIEKVIAELKKRIANNQNQIHVLRDQFKVKNVSQEIQLQTKFGQLSQEIKKIYHDQEQQKNISVYQIYQKPIYQLKNSFQETFLTKNQFKSCLQVLNLKIKELKENSKKLSSTTNYEQKQSKFLNDLRTEMSLKIKDLSQKLELELKSSEKLMKRISKLETNEEKPNKSDKFCVNSIVVTTKQILQWKNSDIYSDRSNYFFNSTSNKSEHTSTPFSPSVQHLNQNTPISSTNINKRQQIVLRQLTYFIDHEGYLLDENKYYLINGKNQQIKLTPNMLAVLRENQIISNGEVTKNLTGSQTNLGATHRK